ncbi:neuropeptides capa receptor isoform X1 [Culex pipiens pallens]|uniref:neuropeptides capa receptor isoform X1 n=1 Tax=Culex pipiens pallens TaxID=42434 RepID=UPI001953D859|nr:neuropeptides capa receptor isoform X1 [Culex pipiens pallens]XP_052566180.1 neuropeptides capa receptor isoform X1 [Culex pipiens pallens]
MTFHNSSDGVNGEDDRVPLWPNATAKVLTALLTTLSSTTPTPTQQLHPVGALWSTSTPASSPPAMAGTPDLAWLALFNYSFVTGAPPGGTNFTGVVHPSQNDSLPYDLLELDRCDPGNAHFECSVQDFLEYARGPQQMPLSTALLVTILFVGILVTGVIGNLIVCLVIIRHPAMHTATNYYLFSLAVSDLILLLLGLPYEISLYWHQYPYSLGLAFCKIRALISEASTYVSVLTIVAFSMERFLAICHPLHLYTMSGLQRPVRIIAGLWIVSLLSAVPFAVFTDIDYIEYPPTKQEIPDSAFCAMLQIPERIPLWELSTCLFFAVPMAVMVVLYGRMGMQIRSRTQRTLELGVRNGSVNGPSRVSQSRKAIIRMLAAVVITFFVCWAPFHAQRLLYLYGRDWQHFNTVNTWLFSVAGWLYYVSCTINPILYNVMSHRYRVAFRETLCGRRRGFGTGFARDQSSFRETTVDVNVGCENSKLLRARSMMQSKRYKGALHATNSVRYSDNCIRRNSLQLGRLPGSRRSLSPNLTTDVVVMLENNLSGRPRCFTTTSTTSTLAATTTESSLKVPLISINGPISTGVAGSETTTTTTNDVNGINGVNVNSINRSISRENNHSTASTPLASSQASSNLSIDELNQTTAASKQHQLRLLSEEESSASQTGEDNANCRHHPQLNLHLHHHQQQQLPSSHQLINGYDSDDDDKRRRSSSSPTPTVGDIPCRNGPKRETCI